ncbi:Multidrug resistance protein MdtN [Rubripirellula tenax]|uniref:Multidrug resistance protein MdtN n=1 Tax=Rubripirellula tenax TaxID=2528015 RepID=A0A5C6FES8_9BACT|nr:HlyD family efflux transporter periplasmic adaptor subunit [Rubripirellula tenax]TWU59262.1 Multidrug resistance protein MdtN [Rubripirellula tenax]
MNKRPIPTLFLRYVAPLMVLGCAGWFVYSMGAQERPERKKPPVRKSIPVELVQAQPHTGTLDIVVSGVAIPYREVQLAARVSGEVVFKSESVSPGHVVAEGELLIRVDPTDYEIEVARLEQEVAKVNLEIQRLQLDKENTQRVLSINQDILSLRKREVQRLARLRNANATSASEADAVELAMLSAVQQTTSQENQLRTFESQSKTLQTTLELATLQLRRAKLDLERTEIKAPFSGVVIANHVEQNGMLSAGDIVASVEDTSKVEVRASLRGDDMAFLQGGGYELPQVPVTVEYDRDGKTYAWSAVLSRQDGLGVDEKTRTIPVRICVDNPTQNCGSSNDSLALLRGMFVRVRLHCEPQRPLLVVPESVIRPGKNVWVMRGDELQIEPVRVARIRNGIAYLHTHDSALNRNEQIISSPVPNAKPGLAVSMIANEPRRGAIANGNRQGSRPDAQRVLTSSATAIARP